MYVSLVFDPVITPAIKGVDMNIHKKKQKSSSSQEKTPKNTMQAIPLEVLLSEILPYLNIVELSKIQNVSKKIQQTIDKLICSDKRKRKLIFDFPSAMKEVWYSKKEVSYLYSNSSYYNYDYNKVPCKFYPFLQDPVRVLAFLKFIMPKLKPPFIFTPTVSYKEIGMPPHEKFRFKTSQTVKTLKDKKTLIRDLISKSNLPKAYSSKKHTTEEEKNLIQKLRKINSLIKKYFEYGFIYISDEPLMKDYDSISKLTPDKALKAILAQCTIAEIEAYNTLEDRYY